MSRESSSGGTRRERDDEEKKQQQQLSDNDDVDDKQEEADEDQKRRDSGIVGSFEIGDFDVSTQRRRQNNDGDVDDRKSAQLPTASAGVTEQQQEQLQGVETAAAAAEYVGAQTSASAGETRCIVIRGVDFLATEGHLAAIVATVLGPERMETNPVQLIKRRVVTIEQQQQQQSELSTTATTSSTSISLPTEDVEVHFLKIRDAKTVLESMNRGHINGRTVTCGYI
jgi:hypothetical protein